MEGHGSVGGGAWSSGRLIEETFVKKLDCDGIIIFFKIVGWGRLQYVRCFRVFSKFRFNWNF
jgi:hypothetical protein